MNKKRLLIIAGAIIVLVSTLAVFKSKDDSDSIRVFSEEVEKRKIIEVVSANGKVQPELEVKLSPEVSGEIVTLGINEGMKVTKEDVLVKLNPDIYIAAMNRAEAGLNSSKANVANAKARLSQSKARLISSKADFERNAKLLKQNVISQSDFDQIQANYSVAEEEVKAAEESVRASEFSAKSALATLNEARDNLKRTTIYSPIDGTISKLDVELGERVVGTSQMAGTEMLRVADLTRMEVNVEVNESDIVKVKLGDKATVEVDAYVNRKFQGEVTEIANSSSNSGVQSADQVTVFDVKVRILESSYKDLVDPKHPHLSPFRPGMSATVEIITKEAEKVLSVPIQAVTIRADSTVAKKKSWKKVDNREVDEDNLMEVVFVIEDGIAKRKWVKTGIQNTKYIEITEGLNDGDVVVSGPYSIVSKDLVDGDAIEVKTKEEMYSIDKD